MPRRTLHLVIALCLATGAAGAQKGESSRADLAAFDKLVAKAARDWRVPGLAIAVVKDDSLVFSKGYGVLEAGKPAPATAHSRFAIGSTTKAMTAAALAMLVDDGRLKWDDRVIDYLPDFRMYDPWVTRELTIRDVLTHRSGLPGVDLLWIRGDLTNAEMISRLRTVKPSSSFRSRWEYNNVVYSMAGAIIAKASGMPWEQFIRTRLFAPLQMRESLALVSDLAGQPDLATPHALQRDTVRTVPVRNTDAVAPAGSVWSSVADMSRWMRFMLDSGRVGSTRLIAPATFRELVAPQMRAPMAEYPALSLARPNTFSYALGWFVQDYHGSTIWMHTGSIDGMTAIIGLMPDRRLGVYVLANLDHAELRHALMYQAFDLYASSGPARDWSADLRALLDSTSRARRATVAATAPAAAAPAAVSAAAAAAPALPREKYPGTYADSTYGEVVVALRDGALRARFGALDFGVLDAGPYDTFKARGASPDAGGTAITFVPDGAGGVASLRVLGATFAKRRNN